MNERIREFAEKAFIVTTGGNIGHVNEYMIENFAELIVRECAEVAHCNFHVDGVTLGNIMKEHFGVEE
jgi:hypothetical protein